MLSSGYGLSLSSSFGYHFIPSRIYLGMYMQSIIAFDEVSSGKTTGWASLGISLGANVGDINPDLLKPYKDKLDEEALFFNILKEVITKSDIVFSNDYAFAIDTIITEAYSKPDPFKSILIRTPFAMTLGNSKLNGVLIRVVVSNVPEVKDIAGWVGQENWFYLTLNEAVFAEGVLENLVTSSPILEIEGIQNKQSVQIGFLMENYISDFEIFHSPSNRVFLIHVWHELDGSNIADIRKSESENSNKIFSLNDQNSKGTPFYESFISIPKTC